MFPIVLQLVFVDKAEIFDCFISSDIQIIPSSNRVCLDISYPIVSNENCPTRLPHGVLFRATLDSLFQNSVQQELESIMTDFSYKQTPRVCFECVSNAGVLDCTVLDETNKVTISVESETHRSAIDVKSIRIDRLEDTCLTPKQAVFDDASICWKFLLANTPQCLVYYQAAGSFSFQSVTYQILLNDGSNVREVDIVPTNSTTSFAMGTTSAELQICQILPRTLDLQRLYVTTTDLQVRQSTQSVIIDAYMEFYTLSFTETDDVITGASLTVQQNSALLVLTYNPAEVARLNAILAAYGARLSRALLKVTISITATNEYLEISYSSAAYRFGYPLAAEICSASLNPETCPGILQRILEMKQSEYNAYFLVFFLDTNDASLLQVLEIIPVVKYSCLQSSSADIYYNRIEVLLAVEGEECDYSQNEAAISLLWTNSSTGEQQAFTGAELNGSLLVFKDASFRRLYDACRLNEDYLLFLDLGFDGVFINEIYFKDETVITKITQYGFITVVLCCVALAVVLVFDDRILYRIQRNKKRSTRRVNGEIVEDDI